MPVWHRIDIAIFFLERSIVINRSRLWRNRSNTIIEAWLVARPGFYYCSLFMFFHCNRYRQKSALNAPDIVLHITQSVLCHHIKYGSGAIIIQIITDISLWSIKDPAGSFNLKPWHETECHSKLLACIRGLAFIWGLASITTDSMK